MIRSRGTNTIESNTATSQPVQAWWISFPNMAGSVGTSSWSWSTTSTSGWRDTWIPIKCQYSKTLWMKGIVTFKHAEWYCSTWKISISKDNNLQTFREKTLLSIKIGTPFTPTLDATPSWPRCLGIIRKSNDSSTMPSHGLLARCPSIYTILDDFQKINRSLGMF